MLTEQTIKLKCVASVHMSCNSKIKHVIVLLNSEQQAFSWITQSSMAYDFREDTEYILTADFDSETHRLFNVTKVDKYTPPIDAYDILFNNN